MNTLKLLFAITLITVGSMEVLAQETFSFPSRASDLAPGQYWTVAEFGEGANVIDFNVQQYSDSANQWVGGTGSTANNQNYDWGLPLYAPASGRIISCWRNFPDNLFPHATIRHPNIANIFTGGNHVVILTDENNVISLNHFQSGTIRPELCPSNPDNTVYPSTMARTANNDWRVAAFIQPEDRPRIREGEYIGAVGSSGNSSGPHLHMSVSPVTNNNIPETVGDSIPLRFRDVWGHRFEDSDRDTPEGWYRHRGAPFTGNPACSEYVPDSPECGFKMIHPSPYLRRAAASSSQVKEVDPVFLSSNRAVTASIETSGQLKLTSWDLIGTEQIILKDDLTTQGTVKDVQIAKDTSTSVMVAVRTQSDDLKMISYNVDPWGRFTRTAEHLAGDINSVSLTEISPRKFVTATRGTSGMKLIVWNIQSDSNGNTTILRLGEAETGTVSAVSVTRARNFTGVITAVRDGSGNLMVIPFKISTDGYTLTRGEEGTAGAILSTVSATALSKGVAVGVRDNDGDLRVITFESNHLGNIVARRETVVEGDVSEVELVSTPLASSNFTAVVRDGDGSLRLIGFKSNDNGTDLRRVGSVQAGSASSIASAGVSRTYPGLDSRDMILTTMRDGDGDLRLITYDTNLINP